MARFSVYFLICFFSFVFFIHTFISIFVFMAVVVHAICVWSSGGTSCGKSWVINFLLKMQKMEVGLDALTLR